MTRRMTFLGSDGRTLFSDPYASYIVFDSLTDIDDTLLTAHTPEKDQEGGGWQVGIGTSHKIVGGVAVGNDGETVIDCGLNRNFKVSYRGRRAGGFGNAFNVLYTDSNNYAVAVIFNTIFSIYTIIGGVAGQTIGGTGEPDSAVWHDCRIEMDVDGLMSFYVDDALQVQRDASSVPLSALVGMSSRIAHSNNGNEFDDIIVEAL